MNRLELSQIRNVLANTYANLVNGYFNDMDIEFSVMISNLSTELINNYNWSVEEQNVADLIIKIGNITYNNSSVDTLPLDDGLYDQLLVCYRRYNPNYQVGSIPTQFEEKPQNEFEEEKVMINMLTEKDFESKLYVLDLWNYKTQLDSKYKSMIMDFTRSNISKRLINTKHKYPELVGTLDKCKFVLNQDAIDKELFNKPSVAVFERDFIQMCIMRNIIQPNEVFEMVAELKYDGISIEAEVCGDTIVSALSRGDTGEDIATDLTPILGGYKFVNAKDVPTDINFGIKFEAVITKLDLDRMSARRGKFYKNCRNAIIGLFGSSDAYLLRDYITLIPLATSLEMDRITELKFLNKYYSSGHYNRYCILKGDYKSILFQVKQFVESAEVIRPILPYLIDGVVISFIDPHKKEMLGRENSVNKYSMAIKFIPKKVRTIFLGYTFSIGKSGDIIPMVHFKPCEFIGTIHTKQTLHSYNRFKELNLIKGQEIDIEYANDVLTYVTKPDTEYNRNIKGEPFKFIEVCPCCGSKIEISESGKSAYCPNRECGERKIMRMVDMISRLGFKDFSEETVRTLNLTSLKQLFGITVEQLSILGPINAQKFMETLNNIINNPIPDYKILSAIGLDDMAEEKWKTILKELSIHDIINLKYDELYNKLISIKSIGNKIAETICLCRQLYEEDLNIIISRLNIINYKDQESKPKIALTGFRDKAYIDLLNDNGFDVSDKYSLTKDCYCLITNDINSTSGKMDKAKKFGIPIYTKQQFLELNNINL